MILDLKVDSSIDFFVVEIVDMLSTFRDFVTKTKKKMQDYYIILDFIISDL